MKGIIVAAVGMSLGLTLFGEEVLIHVEKSTTVTFQSQNNRSYKFLASEDPTTNWRILKDGIAGTGGEVTIFYKSETDQKLFFKVETSDGPPGQQSLITLARLDVSDRSLTGYNLEGADLRQYKFYNSLLDNADLAGADLRGAGFQNASMKGADLRNVVLDNTSFYQVNFDGANLSGVNLGSPYVGLTGADLRGAILNGTKFVGANLVGATLAGNTLTGVSFRGANLEAVDFTRCNLSGADLSRTDLNNVKMSGANLNGVNFEAASVSGVSMAGRDLRSCVFRGAQIGSADWSGVNLAGADLSFASANGGGSGPGTFPPKFDGADFSGCNLEGFKLGFGDLLEQQVILRNVNFRNANLRYSRFFHSKFVNCDFTGADLTESNIASAETEGCIGIDPTPKGEIIAAPEQAPFHLVFNVTDGGATNKLEFTLSSLNYTLGLLPLETPWPVVAGRFTYKPGRIATLELIPDSGYTTYTLVFTSSNGGTLFKNIAGPGTALFLFGTFQIPQ